MGLFSKHSGRIAEGWVFDAKAPLLAAAAIAEHHGQPHLIIGTARGAIICLDQQGKEVWTFHTNEKFSKTESYFVDEERVHSVDAPPVVADMNNDGKQEILFGTEAGTLYCLSLEGKQLWKHDTGGSIRAAPAVIDINSDGHQEILIGSTNNKLTILSGTGKQLFEYIGEAPVESVATVLKTRKHPLIIFGDNTGRLTAITPAQQMIWNVELKDKITAQPVAITVNNEHCVVVGTLGGLIACISETGELVWKYTTDGSIYGKAAVADINNDDKQEIVVCSCDNTVYALTTDGQRVWSYETDFWLTGSPIITDIDNDHKLEVVVGSYDHNVYVLDGNGTYVLDYVPGLSSIVHQAGHYSNTLTSDPGEQMGKKLWQYQLDNIIVGCTVIEHHGKPVIVATTKTGHVNTLTYEQ